MLKIKWFRKCLSPAFLLAAMLVPLLSSCGPTDRAPRTINIAPDPYILRVGVSANSPPLIYSKNNTFTGLEADFAKELGRFTGKKVKFVELKWQDQITALENNTIDIIMSGMSITQAREYRIAFSNPYLRSGQILLVRLGEKALFSTGIYSLMNSNYVIGTVKNTTGDLFITKTLNGAKVKNFTTSADAVKALINKDIDVFVYDAPMVCHYAAMNENNKLTPILTLATEEYIAWGIRKEDSELLNQANAFLTELKTQQELQRMIRTWIPYM
jgi:polar amino acid transport system substrate-binding protein